MRLSFLIVSLLALGLTGCGNVPTQTASLEGNTLVLPGTYAMASVAPTSGATITPSNPCAASYDDAITTLEKLMAKNAANKAAVQ